ncbi:hypothetical protein Cva_00278 [Caedimonas varicaedens]|jgi:hypothetical protein|uniref:Uncharacterized protein n=1 Tax=Caedimonas varicaedens TaxID=1629334 RepID=A0A0K8MB08_9PROT|nr:hypothetical protein Cva_00278 [Caedimonas varicaedens]
MKGTHTGKIKFYNLINEACKFVIKPDDDELYIVPARCEEPLHLDSPLGG